MARPPRPLADRFEDFVDRSDPDGCWPWTGPSNRQGYGRIGVKGQDGKWRWPGAHRVAWELEYGEPLGVRQALHECDNPPCVRVGPGHVHVGTHAQNMAERNERGRADRGPNPAKARRGEQHGRARLTVEQVETIKTRYRGGGVTQQTLADEFGISQPHVGNIVRGRRWSET